MSESFHNHNPRVHELIVGDTLNALDLPSIIRFKKRLLPVRYFPTIVSTQIGVLIYDRNSFAYYDTMNLSFCKYMKGIAVDWVSIVLVINDILVGLIYKMCKIDLFENELFN